jgi:ABC-type nitrate/sulfonate/bicarbonate transport system substrate-binding protein
MCLMRHNTLFALVIAVILVAVGCAPAATTAPTAAPTAAATASAAARKTLDLTVVLAWPAAPPICCMMDQAAKDLGYYKKHDLNVNFVGVSGSALTIQTLAAGKADVASGTAVAAGIGAYVAGSTDIRYIGGELNSNPQINKLKWLFSGLKTINTPADLKGKTIGVSAGANPTDPGYVEIHALLLSAGLTDNDVNWVVAGTGAARIQALVAGRIDFTQNVNPELSYQILAEPKLQNVWWDPVGTQGGWNGCACWFAMATAYNDPDKKEAIQRYVDATIEMIRDLAEKPDVFKQAMSLYTDMKPQTAESIQTIYDYWRLQYQANGAMNLIDMSNWFNNTYLTTINTSAKGKVTLRQVVDTQFVDSALKTLGVDTNAYWDPPQLTFPVGQ